MPTAKEYKDQIQRLLDEGNRLLRAFGGFGPDGEEAEREEAELLRYYVGWYTEVFAVVRFLLPERLEEFRNLYLADPKRKELSKLNYTIQDWLLGRQPRRYPNGRQDFDEDEIVGRNLLAQLQILRSCLITFDSILMNFKKLTLADLFDSELEGAREILRAGFLPSAGVIARVVLERHLKDLCETHQVGVKKRSRNKPADLADYNNSLKEAEVFDIPQWRKIQHLGDISNYCCHDKEREPTKEEVEELIDGTEKVIKTVF